MSVAAPVVTPYHWPNEDSTWSASTYRFESDGAVLISDSALRFRERDEIESSLTTAGFELLDVRDAPDRPDKEFVFVTQVAG